MGSLGGGDSGGGYVCVCGCILGDLRESQCCFTPFWCEDVVGGGGVEALLKLVRVGTEGREPGII
jgi:hypothetical protein